MAGMDSIRDELQTGSMLRLKPYGSAFGSGDLYEILSTAGRGASSVCYNAKSHFLNGRLKEFSPLGMWDNPLSNISLTRNEATNQISVSGKEISDFGKLCDNFIRPYRHLQEIRNRERGESPIQSVRILNNYMPSSQILCGCDSEGNSIGSVYIWTPGDREGIEFGEYLDKLAVSLARNPGSDAGEARRALKDILITLESITDCVGILHGAGILHLDLKPSNFLVALDSEGRILPEQISLYDMNSMYDIDSSEPPAIIGTEGFMAPELRYGEATHRADIYSIGAILYQALVVNNPEDRTIKARYSDDLYRSLPGKVRDSVLLQRIEIDKHAYLEDTLTGILESCLAYDKAKRFRSCEDLKAALKKAEAYLGTPSSSIYSEQQRMKANAPIVLQKLLSDHPLYDVVENEQEDIQVVIIGDGTWSRIFLDQCLTISQNLRNRLKVSFYAENPDNALWRYRSSRPAIQEYVDLNDKNAHDDRQAFASISYYDLKDQKRMERRIRRLSSPYLFISLETDRQSSEAAVRVGELLKNTEKMKVSFAYVGDGSLPKEELPDAGREITAVKLMEHAKISAAVEKMAFNTFLTWRGAGKFDMRAERKHFRDKYQYQASVSSALSIQYKLHMLESAGILQGRSRRKQQAKQLKEMMPSEEFQPILAELAMREHKRWILEKVSAGWHGIGRMAEQVYFQELETTGNVRDSQTKLHPCIARSSMGNVLETLTEEQWDDSTYYPPGADDLDIVSLSIHRSLLKREAAGDDVFVSNHGLYCNYKKYDFDLIKAIPEIMLQDPSKESAPVAYDPKPADTSDVVLPADLEDLTEHLAENTHDIWARGRIDEGWRYGKRKSEALKTTPDLIPYPMLTDSEKVYDRNTAIETLKLIIKMGYRIEKV